MKLAAAYLLTCLHQVHGLIACFYLQVNQYWEALTASIAGEDYEGPAGGGAVNPYAMLPDNMSYYTYLGSLTVPPCSETVT